MIDWFRSKWKIILAVLALVILVYAILQFIECRKLGKASGKSFKCSLFSSKPVSILPIDEYYDMREGECYKYLDFGDRMSVRKVGLDKCN